MKLIPKAQKGKEVMNRRNSRQLWPLILISLLSKWIVLSILVIWWSKEEWAINALTSMKRSQA
jgi:hypothetical protein